MKHVKIFAVFALTGIFSLTAFAAQPVETIVTYTVLNKGDSAVTAYVSPPVTLQPNSSETRSSTHDLKILSMRNGDVRSTGQSFLVVSGERTCKFSTSLTLKKVDNIINYETTHQSQPNDNKLTSCVVNVIEEPSKPSYSYKIQMVMR
ncbi:hypothetical protein ACYZT9_20700 [Pseudomonas sp. ZT5P21]